MSFDQSTPIGSSPFASKARIDTGHRRADQQRHDRRQARRIAKELLQILKKDNLKVVNSNPFITGFSDGADLG